MKKKEEDKSSRFAYDSDLGLSLIKDDEGKSKEKSKKIEKSEENTILNRIKKWL